MSPKVDKTLFTEKNIDDMFELHIIDVDQMYLLREAYDIWKAALAKSKEKKWTSQNSELWNANKLLSTI